MATRGISENSFSLDSSVCLPGQDSCAICLGVPKNKSFANNCLHEFCFLCLQKWSMVRAECPLCMQPFSSIIHTVKSDCEYYEHVIQRPGQSVSRVGPQEMIAIRLVAPQQQTAIQDRPTASVSRDNALTSQDIHSRVNVAVEKQSVAQNQMTAPSVALPTQQVIATLQQVTATQQHSAIQQQVTAAQIYLEAQETLLPRKAETVHQYSLRSKTRRESIPNVASNVNEFCPLNSSIPQRPCSLQLSQVTATPVDQSQWWHRLVCEGMRNLMVQEMVQAIIPDPSFMNQNEMETVCGYARKFETDLYKTANSKQQYTLLHSTKINEFRTDMDQKQKRAFIQRILSSSKFLALDLERPLDLSNPRSTKAVLINLNATGAKEHLQIVDEKEEEDEECNNPSLFTGSDGSGRNGSSMVENTDGIQHTGQVSFVDDSEEVVILEMDPKPLPELIILSDSDDE
ncbi:uncharacterized protein LOC124190878 [Daphnia pulex]|uniref:uncharacterized protein LOC124190878 n=1 Tax=Daphnia pulex TaxID=6669 RepID=UPI001EDFA0EA|nr:uncharacterized protein LOC124190878 [Daphnia pulex]